MKVLFWTASFWPNLGGLEVISTELVTSLVERGVEVLVMAPGEGREMLGKVPIFRLPFDVQMLGDLDLLLEWRKTVMEIKRDFAPDVIHVNGPHRGAFLHLTTRQAWPAPTVLTLHGNWPGGPEMRESVAAQLLRTSSWVTACSSYALEQARRYMPEIRARSSVVYNALPEPSGETGRRERRPTLLCAGRLAREKGFDQALEAFSLLRGHPELRLEFAGVGYEMPRLRQLAESLGVSQRVDFLGRLQREELLDRMRRARMVLVPSLEEGFGLVALEAALVGTPVVASRVEGLPELVLHEETGLLTPPVDPPGLAAAIQRLLDDPEGAERMGQRARDSARSRFVWSDCVSAYESLYRTLSAPAGGLVEHAG